jgi:hypothetical protein
MKKTTNAALLSSRKALSRWGIPLTLLVTFFFALLVPGTKDQSIGEGISAAQSSPAVKADTQLAKPASAETLVSADMLGLSGRLRAVMGTPDVLGQNPMLKPLISDGSSGESAAWPTLLTPDGDSFTVVTLVPITSAGSREYARYHVGSWPSTGIASSAVRYEAPRGFIGVTQENQGTKLSSNFAMRDFLTHDQGNVWPKVLVLRPALLDKLELLRIELEKEGLPSRLHVMSGFRTPQYNAQGVGKGGRAGHSRHMYGDAADVFVDADSDGMMDDLNGDGKITRDDAKVLRDAAEQVEKDYPSLVGGLSAYAANEAHGPFVHVDARGVKARW